MAAMYKIVCVTTEHPHRHITGVGVGESAAAPSQRFTVTEVREKLDKGHLFYTLSPSTRKTADVKQDTCRKDGCSVETIRSKDDAVQDNNLDNLSVCP